MTAMPAPFADCTGVLMADEGIGWSEIEGELASREK